MPIFTDRFFHLGADEVVFNCWNLPWINEWMVDNNLPNYPAVLNYFEQKLYAITANNNRVPVNWEEVFEQRVQLPDDVVVQVWIGFSALDSVIRAGHKAILSNSNAWYLDCGEATWCPYCSWVDMYLNDPLTGSTAPPEQQALILGGESCLWGELVDERNFDRKAWPRAAAVGERLWSPQSVKDVPNAMLRLLHHTCRLASRGVDAGVFCPGSSPTYCRNIQQ